MKRIILLAVMTLTLAGALSACGDTWRGVKEDTGENMRATGRAIEGAGQKVEP
jgi:predicted small secreted protein